MADLLQRAYAAGEAAALFQNRRDVRAERRKLERERQDQAVLLAALIRSRDPKMPEFAYDMVRDGAVARIAEIDEALAQLSKAADGDSALEETLQAIRTIGWDDLTHEEWKEVFRIFLGHVTVGSAREWDVTWAPGIAELVGRLSSVA